MHAQYCPMRVIILDRDGVINEDSEHYIKSAAEFRAIPGSLEAIARLNNAGWRVYLATNQAGIARGKFGYSALANIHAKLQRQLTTIGGHLDGIFFCPCLACDCRKPAPGMLEDIAKRLRINLTGISFVGDSLRDLQAATAAGAQPVLVKTGNGNTTAQQPVPAGTIVYDSLATYAEYLLAD